MPAAKSTQGNDDDTGALGGADLSRATQQGILTLLLDQGSQRPWATRELELEVSEAREVEDALRALQGAGLVHHCGEFVWATRAALAADALSL